MHLKYRPSNFDEVIGNKEVIKSIKENLKSNPVRPIMLEGSTGLGKSSLSYIIAKEWKADTIREINCVDLAKVEEIRDLLDTINQPSLFEERVCLILDEIQGLSDKSMQLLRKPLESTKPNILYIACTSGIDKIARSNLDLLERFLRFKIKPSSDTELNKLLTRVCGGENISIPKWLKLLLIEKSEGIPRRLLTGLAKVKSITDEAEAKYLLDLNSIEEEAEILELFKIVLKGVGWATVKNYLQVVLKSFTPESIRISFMNLIMGRLNSNYMKEGEGEKLIKAYEVLRNMNNIPEKAGLTVDIYKIGLIFK
jgi:DNA polymerase-3 subunit gamma/tau